MDDFLKEFFPKIYRRKQSHLNETDYCKYDNQILTLFTSSLYFAALVATFGASYVTRNKGRRASILVRAVSFFVGAILIAAAVNIAMLILGRIFLGFGIGFGNQVQLRFYISPISSILSPSFDTFFNESKIFFRKIRTKKLQNG
ncbi:hypothetical protein QQ045_010956 [Rhodiola kirilowii]